MALQHLRSSTANKRPVPGNMSEGQLAINTASGSPGLFFKDSNANLVKVGPVHVGTTAPNASPASGGTAGNSVGEQWLDTSSSRYVFKIWDGSAWRSEDGEFVNASGDVMTGALGIIAGTAAAPGLYFSGDTNTGIYSPGADQLALATNGTGRLFVDSSGNVGIKTSAPFQYGVTAADLAHLQLTSDQFSIVTFGGSGGATGQKYWRLISRASQKKFQIQSVDDSGSSESTALEIVKGTAQEIDNVQLHTNGSERLRITSDGKVGVGTSSPSYQLHVTTDFAVGAAGFNQQLTFGNDTIQSLLLGTGYTALKLNPLGGAIYFQTTSTPSTSSYGTVISSGNVLLHSRNTTSAVAQFYGSSGENRLLGNGSIQNTLNSYGAISDAKLKENIEAAGSQWDDLKALQVVNFNFIGSDQRQIGLIAQQVEQVSPGLVDETPDDEAGTTTTKAVKYSVLYMKAVKALQEAMERIEALEARIAAAGI